MTEADIQEFCARYRSGDRRTCLSLLYSSFKSQVTGRCRSIAGSDEEAAELTQRVFFEAAERMERLRKPEKVDAWFWGTVVRSVQTAYFRDKKRQSAHRPSAPDAELTAPHASSVTDARAQHEAIARIADQQKDPYDRLIVLHRGAGRTFKEISDILFWNEDRVKRRFQRLKKRLDGSAREDWLP